MTPLQQALAARRRVTGGRKPRDVPRVAPPNGAVVAYTRILLDASDAMDGMILDALRASGHIRIDDALPADLLKRLQRALSRVWGTRALMGVLEHLAASVIDRSGREFRKQIQRALGVNLLSDPDLSKFVNTFRDENVKLIQSLAQDKIDRVREVLDAGGMGTRVEVTAKAIQQATGATRARATLIARDQVLGLNADVTRARHEAAGISTYRWSASRDERVRPIHQALDGSVHRYTEPPVISKDGRRGNPGEDYQCRCVAIPILPE